MADIVATVRGPTGSAWVLLPISVITCGEGIRLWWADGPAAIFDTMPVSVAEVILLVWVSGLFTIASVVWLISLYTQPGWLRIDLTEGVVRRVSRPYIRQRLIEGPLDQWTIRLVFYSHQTREVGSFKRLELTGPGGFEESLLFTDVRRGDQIARALEELADAPFDFDVVVQREATGAER